MFKKCIVLLTVIGTFFSGTIPASAAFNVAEPFSAAGPLSSSWITSGTALPNVANQAGDTPENALRLTDNDFYQNGYVLYDTTFNLSQGVQFDFKQYQWGGDGADGLVFFIKKGSDTVNVAGGLGGALGYAPNPGNLPGISGALLGVGFDAYGNFKNYEGTGCGTDFPTGSLDPNEITIKGPGQDFAGYCLLANPYNLVSNSKKLLANNYVSRQESAAAVRINIDSPFIDEPRVKVYYEDTLVQDVALPVEFKDTAEIKFGFTAGTGALKNFNEISNLRVKTLDKSLPFSPYASSETLANTGGALGDFYVLLASSIALVGGGVYSVRRSRKTRG